ncbi:MAG: magnesium/cobalt transporter CorA [Armatimonas sp.]
MISIDFCDGKTTQHNLTPEQIHALLQGEKKTEKPSHPTVWIDVTSPTEEDWALLKAKFDFHPLAMEDAYNQRQRPKVDSYGEYLFLSVKAWKGSDKLIADVEALTQEIDIFLGPNYLITIHDEDSGPIKEIRRRLDQNPTHLRSESGFLLYMLLDALVDEYFPVMDALDEDIDVIETSIYESEDSLDFKPAVKLKKRLLILRQTVSPMRDVLNQLMRTDNPALISPELQVYYQDVYDHTLRLVEQIDLHRDIMGGVIDVMMSQTSNRLNQVMKTLTGISTILMTAALIAGIYGMNFKNMPETNWPDGYFYALGLMVAIALGLTFYFKKIKWF